MRFIEGLKGLVEVLQLLVALLDTPGGQILVMAGMMGTGGMLLHSGVMEGGSILTGAFGALLGFITRGRLGKDHTTEGAK